MLGGGEERNFTKSLDFPYSQGPQKKKTDRGYDFQAVVRWFAERADVIFLFFDPGNKERKKEM